MKNYRSYNGSLNETEGRTVEGYAIRFNEESQNLGFFETIDRSALTQDVIDNSDIYCKLNHRDDAILARSRYGEGSLSLELREDGLFYSFEAPNTQYGDELLEHIKRGEISTSSFAFSIEDSDVSQRWYKEDGVLKRTILKIAELYDVSPTFEGAYLTTSCSSRSLEDLKDEVAEISEKIDTELRMQEETVEEERSCKDEEDKRSTDEKEEESPKQEDEPTEEIEDKEGEDNSEGEDKVEEEETTEEVEENKENKKERKMNKEFSLISAIRSIASNRPLDEVSEAVVNAGKEEMRKSGLAMNGQIQLPVAELRSTVTVAAEGTDVVPTDLYDIMEPLRAKNVLVQAGAKLLTGLVGDVQVPIMGAGNVTWEGETASAKDAGYVFTSAKLSPKRLTAYVDISKQFLAQDAKDAEGLIRADLVNAINAKLESTILGSSAGTSTQPEGIFYTTGSVASVTSYTDVASLEASIEDANVNGECKYIMSNKAKAVYRTSIKGTNGTGMIYENGTIDGTEVLNTSHVANKLVAYGDWSNLAIGQWSAIDLTVDPYTKAADGQIRLVINAFFDAKVLRPEAFAIGKAEA